MLTFNHSFLEKLREKNQWSRPDVVFKLYDKGLRIAVATILNWETGKSEPGAEELGYLAELYGVSVNDLMKDDDK